MLSDAMNSTRQYTLPRSGALPVWNEAAKALRGWLWTAYASDTSRERRRNYSRHAETLRRIAAHSNPFSRLTCPAIDPKKTGTAHESELGKRFTRFRLYASIPWKVKESDVSDLAEAMTALA